MNEVLKKLSKKSMNGMEVAEILNKPQNFPTEIIENLSIETALNYWNGIINFLDGDIIMNNLKTLWVTNDHYFENFGFGKIARK